MPKASSSTSPRWRWLIRSLAGCSATSPRCRGCSTPKRWSSGCVRLSRSHSSSSGCHCPAFAPRSTSSVGWSCCAALLPPEDATMLVPLSENRPIATSEDVVAVRQAVRQRAVELGFNLVDQTKIVTAASELARNTLHYGGGGTLRIEEVLEGARRGLRLVFEDNGPGIADIEPALKDGDTTRKGPGLGLAGGQALSKECGHQSPP